MKFLLENIKYCFCIVGFLGLTSSNLQSQIWSQFGMANLNSYRDISAYGGLDRVTMFSSQIRSQWTELPGSPNSQYLGVHTPVYIWKGAVGLDIMNQSHGNVSVSQIRASYNYVKPISYGLISIGGRLGFIQGRIDGNRTLTPEGDYSDGLINHNDPNLNNQLASGITPNWEISTAFISEQFSVGASILNFPLTRVRAENTKLTFKSQLNLNLKYFFYLSDQIGLQASTVVRSDFINTQTEVSAVSKINGNIFGGIIVRGYSSSSIDAVGIIFGHAFNNKLSAYYAYEFGLNSLNNAHQGSHELLVKYRIGKLFGTGLPPKTIYNPRFL